MGTFREEVRDEVVRGIILRILIMHQLDWVAISTLRTQLQRGQGYVVSDENLKFQLAYLGDASRGYIEAKPLRAGRGVTEFALVRATAKAVDLRDGRISEDPGVAF